MAARGRFARRVRSLRGESPEQLSALFGASVALPEDFGSPRRRRLFFPLAGVLAVLVAGPVGGSRLPGDAAQLPGASGLAGEKRLGPDGRLLQGEPVPGRAEGSGRRISTRLTSAWCVRCARSTRRAASGWVGLSRWSMARACPCPTRRRIRSSIPSRKGQKGAARSRSCGWWPSSAWGPAS